MQLESAQVGRPDIAHLEDVLRNLVDGAVEEERFVVADGDALHDLVQINGQATALWIEPLRSRVSASPLVTTLTLSAGGQTIFEAKRAPGHSSRRTGRSGGGLEAARHASAELTSCTRPARSLPKTPNAMRTPRPTLTGR